MQAIIILKSEHRSLAAVLYTLEQLIECIEQGKYPDIKIFHGLFTYLNRFLDRYHHPKENQFLFPKLLARAPENIDLIDSLVQEHKLGELYFTDMLKALSAYEFSGESEFPDFKAKVLKYTNFERAHAIREEREILPRAIESLEPCDWEEIDAAFLENVDPMMENNWSDNFSALFQKIINELPEPLGLGKAMDS